MEERWCRRRNVADPDGGCLPAAVAVKAGGRTLASGVLVVEADVVGEDCRRRCGRISWQC